jgi:hypothetical protein
LLFLLKANNKYIFGAYTTKPLPINEKHEDKEAFLFSFNLKRKVEKDKDSNEPFIFKDNEKDYLKISKNIRIKDKSNKESDNKAEI